MKTKLWIFRENSKNKQIHQKNPEKWKSLISINFLPSWVACHASLKSPAPGSLRRKFAMSDLYLCLIFTWLCSWNQLHLIEQLKMYFYNASHLIFTLRTKSQLESSYRRFLLTFIFFACRTTQIDSIFLRHKKGNSKLMFLALINSVN